MFAKTEFPGYLKDPNSKIIINNNESEYQKILRKRTADKKQEERWQKMEQRLRAVEIQLNELKANTCDQ